MNALALGGFLAAAGVLQGAFGAHTLKAIGPERLAFWTTATHYHLLAAIGLMVVGLCEPARGCRAATTGFLLGITLFSGSLYAMALGAPRWLGAITPIGGLSLIFGFVCLGIVALRRSEPGAPK